MTVPELGTIRAAHPPVVVLTSNRTRDLHDALTRRCLYHWIDYPAPERIAEIVRRRVPGSAEPLAVAAAAAVARLRVAGPGEAARDRRGDRLGRRADPARGDPARRRRPSTATLGSVLKNRDDQELVRGRGAAWLAARCLSGLRGRRRPARRSA